MFRIYLKLLIGLISICGPLETVSGFNSKNDNKELKIRVLSDIPENDVNCIFNDSKGFMWIGTLDGLHRYDGYSYKTYRIENGKNSISSNMIIAIDEDSKGNIWIATYGKGISKLNPETDLFTSYESSGNNSKLPNDITSLVVDDQDFLWIGSWTGTTRVRLDSSMENIKHVDFFPIPAQINGVSNNVKVIFQDQKKNIWIGTNHYTQRVIHPHALADSLKFETYNCISQALSDYPNGVLSGGVNLSTIVKLPNQNLYHVEPIADISSFNVLYYKGKIYSGYRNGVTCLRKNADSIWHITDHYTNNLSTKSLSSNVITSLTHDNSGQIWVGTRGGGVSIISQTLKGFRQYNHTLQKGSIDNNLTRCVFEDSNQNLWIGTEEGGVNFLRKGNSYSNGFENILVNSYANENRVYAVEEIKTPKSKKHNNLIFTGTSFPVFLSAYNPATLEKENLPRKVSNLGAVFTLKAQDDSILWAGTYGSGLWKLSVDAYGDITRFQNFSPATKDGSSTLSYIIRSIFQDSHSNIWIGTDKGINIIPKAETVKESPHIRSFTLGKGPDHLSYDYILQIMEAKNGILWIGTMGGGLIKCEPSQDYSNYTFSTITTANGLPNNTIKSIVEDDSGFLWLASNKGLTKYNPIDGSIVNYDKDDGLQDNEFSEICGLKRKNGELVFGGINGFNVFRPNQLQIDTTKPKLYFTDFYILNKEIKNGDQIDGKQILRKTIEYTKSIELDYKHNSFSIGFVGIEFVSPQKNNYRYILEGFDKEWYKASPDYRVAKYTNVPDGEYTFKVMASNSDNIWNEKPIELKIKIDPPNYRSNLAIILYIIFLNVLIYTIFRIVRTISQRKRDLLIATLEKDRVEEISKMKLQFFTNISHEFRTPLSLITTPLEQLIKSEGASFTQKQRYNLNLIRHNVAIMVRLVNQLLDFRKLDQNKLQLKVSKQNLNNFLEDIFYMFEMLAKQKNIKYLFYPIPDDDEIWIDADKMEKVIFNLLSNAFKYTRENGKIVLKAEKEPGTGQFLISVSDNGKGIDEKDQPHIFERYYQAPKDDQKTTGGTGIGLAYSKGLVELHHGEIDFQSVINVGTVFFVKLKKGNSHYPKEVISTNQRFYTKERLEPEEIVQTTENENLNSNKGRKVPKILLVEDNSDLRKQIKIIFETEYKVIEAEDGLDGLRKCREKFPDLVITDVMMPKMDGIEMCHQIKQDEAISHIPILILTAKDTAETQIEGYKTGADSYLPKPFDIDVLKANIESLIKNREQLRSRFQKDIEINPKIISNTPADSKFLEKILSFIENNLSDSDYSVEQLANDYGVSRIYLNRKIKALTGETTIEFMRNIRLKHAAEMLKQNKLNVSEVAWEIGYNDIRTFRKRFKEKFKINPSEFGRKFQNNQ